METPKSAAERRQRYQSRHAILKAARSSWDAHWRELAENFWPRGAQFSVTDTGRGTKVNQHIINGTPIRARRTLAAGMHSAVTPPSREWFALTVDDPQLAELESVQTYLNKVKTVLNALIQRSNFYKEVAQLHDDAVTFGTHLQLVDEDDVDGMRVYPRPVGSYCLVTGASGKVVGFFFETQMTVEQVVEKFGLEACSPTLQELHKSCRHDESVVVVHVVEPNRHYMENGIGWRGKRWVSCWYEGAASESCGFLKEGGYNEQPFLAPRWRTVPGSAYGWCPAMDALGDAKELQLLELAKMRMSELLTAQPTQGPAELDASVVGLLPGEYTAVPNAIAGGKVSPVMDMTALAMGKRDAVEETAKLEARIEALLYVDMWLLLQSRTDPKTAREVDELRDEKLLQLGPITDAMKDDALDPFIARCIGISARRGLLPPPPQELLGKKFSVVYLSPMAQAQRMQSTVGMQRLASFVLNAGQTVPAMLDKLDWDQFIDEYSRAVGVPPTVVRTDEAVQAMRVQRQQAQQQQQQMEAAKTAADTAQKLGATEVGDGQNALQALMRTQGAA